MRAQAQTSTRTHIFHHCENCHLCSMKRNTKPWNARSSYSVVDCVCACAHMCVCVCVSTVWPGIAPTELGCTCTHRVIWKMCDIHHGIESIESTQQNVQLCSVVQALYTDLLFGNNTKATGHTTSDRMHTHTHTHHDYNVAQLCDTLHITVRRMQII